MRVIYKSFSKWIPVVRVEAGFTMIELLIGVSLSVMLMLTAAALFLTFLVGNTKTNANQLVKAEGDYALSQIEFLLRNALQLQPNVYNNTCDLDMDNIRFISLDGGETTLFAETDDDGIDKIASNSGTYLTSSSVELTAGPEFDCVVSDDGLVQYVTINFTLRKGTPGIDQDKEIVEQTFTTGVTLRSY